MKYFFIVTFLCVAVLTAFICRKGFTTSSKPVEIDGHRWKLIAFISNAETITLPQDLVVTAQFRDNAVVGSGGCNQYRGHFKKNNNAVADMGLYNSVNECGEANKWETRYLNTLHKAQYLSLSEHSDTLDIDCGKKGELLFVKVESK